MAEEAQTRQEVNNPDEESSVDVKDEKVETLKEDSSWGGARENAGRKKGSENEKTKQKKEVEAEMKERILKSVDSLLNSQMNLAHGVQMLYCITTNKKGIRSKPQLITDQPSIEAYLAGELEDDENEYYFITTERPDNRALDSLLDRTFGKSRQNIGLDGGEDGKALTVNIVQYGDPNSEPL